MKLPYGVSNFRRLREQGLHFVDKSRYLHRLEDYGSGGDHIAFLRPRRFGKSLWLSFMEHYYDVTLQSSFDSLFAGLSIAAQPTRERGRYLVLRLEFTGMVTSEGPEAFAIHFREKLLQQLTDFFSTRQELIPEAASAFLAQAHSNHAPVLLHQFLGAIKRTPYALYLLVDEYDNFANDLIASGRQEDYYALLSGSGVVKEFYKIVKEGTATGIIARSFLTGVSPVTLDDLTSGANMFTNISQQAAYGDMLGFTDQEVTELLHLVDDLKGDPSAILSDMRRFYNGYLFSRSSTQRVFNPEMVLYFLKNLQPSGDYPENLLTQNVRTDYGMLRGLLIERNGAVRKSAYQAVQEVLTEHESVGLLHEMFPLLMAWREEYFLSLLYSLGLLTIGAPVGPLVRFVVPNYVIAQLQWQMLATLQREVIDIPLAAGAVERTILTMAQQGDMLPFLTLLHDEVLGNLAKRDLIGASEKDMKFVLLSWLSLTDIFYPYSEFALKGGYSDLILTLNRHYPGVEHSFVLELKYIKEREASEKRIAAAFAEADEQLERYLLDARLAGVVGPAGWRALSLVFVGTRALHVRALHQKDAHVIGRGGTGRGVVKKGRSTKATKGKRPARPAKE